MASPYKLPTADEDQNDQDRGHSPATTLLLSSLRGATSPSDPGIRSAFASLPAGRHPATNNSRGSTLATRNRQGAATSGEPATDIELAANASTDASYDRANMSSISLDDSEDENEDSDWDHLSDAEDPPSEQLPGRLRAFAQQARAALLARVQGDNTNANAEELANRFDDRNAVYVPEPENLIHSESESEREHILADYQIPFGHNIHEVYEWERAGYQPTLQDRLYREVIHRVDTAVATGRGFAANLGDVGGYVAAEVRRTGQDLAVVVEENWPDVRRALGGDWEPLRRGWLARAGVFLRDTIAALPPLDHQGGLVRRRRH